jgi:hypothetical protein
MAIYVSGWRGGVVEGSINEMIRVVNFSALTHRRAFCTGGLIA